MKINDLPSVNGYYEWEDQYATLTDHYPNYDARPVIGITGNFGDKGCELAEGYFSCIEAAGGVPLVIPVLTETSALMQILNRIDGLMLSGGGDLNPLLLEQDPSPGCTASIRAATAWNCCSRAWPTTASCPFWAFAAACRS